MTLFNDFMSLIYPRQCEACENLLIAEENFICTSCLATLPQAASSIKAGQEIKMLLAGRVPVEDVKFLYAFEKKGRVQKIIHAIKYQHQKELAVMLGNLLAIELMKEVPFHQIDLIIPIPLHDKKLKIRGFNQSEYFAKGLSMSMQKPVIIEHLIRTKETSTQTKKHKYQRWENVEGIFKVEQLDALKNKHVLLVDDVITTGATIEAAWKAMQNVEGIKLSVAAIAFAQIN